MEIQARFDLDKLDHSKTNTPHLVVSLRAPTLDWVEKRRPIAVIPCIDLSGSMQGEKLKYAKASLLTLIEHLQPGDVAGLVTFANHAVVEVEPQQVTHDLKGKLKRAVQQLQVRGGTNLLEGLSKSIGVIQDLDLPPSFLHRVIMFTDGMPTVGITDTKAILQAVGKSCVRATVSAFGYGAGLGTWGGIDQDFLTALADLGKGNYAYVRDPDAALGAFGKELGGLLSTYATDLNVEIEPVKGHQVTTVVTDVKVQDSDAFGLVEIPISDIMGEEERHFVLATEIAEQKKAFPRDTTVFNVRCSYEVLTEDGSKESRTVETKAKVRFVREADAQSKPHKEVDQIVALHQTIRAQLEAEEEAKKGNYDQASAAMVQISEQIAARGHTNVALVAQNTGQRLGSQAAYTANQGYLRSVSRGVVRAYGTSAVDADAGIFLADCGVSLNSPAQEAVSTSFVESGSELLAEPEPVIDMASPAPALSELLTPGQVTSITTSNVLLPEDVQVSNGLSWSISSNTRDE